MPNWLRWCTAAPQAEIEDGKAVMGATVHERLKKADFSEVKQTDLAELEKISLRLLQQMSLRLSRRIRKMAMRGRVDLRRTIRRSISRGGDPIDLSFRKRKLQPLKLVIALDVSGSMNPYSIFLVRFAYALQKYFKRVDTFLFSTQLTEITSALARAPTARCVGVAGGARGWMVGRNKDWRIAAKTDSTSGKAALFSRHSIHGPERWVGDRRSSGAGGRTQRHQAARAQIDLVEPAAGNGGL